MLNGAAASSLTVPPNKTLRIQGMSAAWRNTTGVSNSGVIRLRAMASGVCAVTSPVLWTIAISSAAGVVGAANGPGPSTVFPDGLEFTGNNTFCASQLMVNTNSGLDVEILGYTY